MVNFLISLIGGFGIMIIFFAMIDFMGWLSKHKKRK
jgi:hypothetical protein